MAVTTDVGTQVLEDTNTLFITFSVSHFWRLDMCFNGILPVMPLTIGALSGTLMVFYISMLIERHLPMVTNVMTAIGRETYIIVAFLKL